MQKRQYKREETQTGKYLEKPLFNFDIYNNNN